MHAVSHVFQIAFEHFFSVMSSSDFLIVNLQGKKLCSTDTVIQFFLGKKSAIVKKDIVLLVLMRG